MFRFFQYEMCEYFLTLMNRSYVEQAGRTTVESCLIVVVLSLAIVLSSKLSLGLDLIILM